MNRRLVSICSVLFIGAITGAVTYKLTLNDPLVTGIRINPVGSQAEVGSFPVNMVLSPNGKFVVVSDVGARQQLSVLDSDTGKVVSSIPFNETEKGQGKQQMYYGLVFGPDGTLFVSRGGQDRVSRYHLSGDGKLDSAGDDLKVPAKNAAEPNFIAGLVPSQDGKQLFAIGNESYFQKTNGKLTGGQGTFNTIDLATGSVQSTVDVGGFPFDVVSAAGGKKAYFSSERDGVVICLDPTTGAITNRIRTGDNPVNLKLSHDGSRVYVSNAGSDMVSVINTSDDQVVKAILVRPAVARGFAGTTPLGLALSADDATLYVACADISAVAVIDTASGALRGYIPVGWYPTSVLLSQDGKRLFVANAKGVQTRNPNGTQVGQRGTYVENVLEGTVSTINVEAVMKDLPNETRTVFRANQFAEQQPSHFFNPHPKHVIYIIKENRTYDQVYGDVAKGNGEPSLCMFPKDVTPNQHALADRFVLLDNFYVCSEVSADGWNWSTSGMANEYTQRNVRVNYGGRGRDYDFEGDTNGTATDLYGVTDVATSPGGYLWDAAAKAHVSFRNYGWFVDADDKDKEAEVPNKKVLQGVTDPDYREFDMGYADSDAWVKLGVHAPKQLLAYGVHKSPSRFSEWKREFDGFVKDGNMPQLMLLRVPCDHTTGTRAGFFGPQALVADNDYALGELVDAVSHSPYWKDTVICVLEDDAQSGQDHIDCHRSGALIISPYVQRGNVSTHFWNTDSMLKTIEVMLGLKPMNHYDGFALPIDVFGDTAENVEPYDAILPDKSIITQVNTRTAYRERDSDRLIKQYSEESGPDIELNDILWGAIMGPKGKR